MSDADLLRQAAALMRERAEAATPGPWTKRRWVEERVFSDSGAWVANAATREDMRHIAGMHPAVALAVADLLDQAADTMHACGGPADCKDCSRALAVARAYLGDNR